jgi:hypothetical protein
MIDKIITHLFKPRLQTFFATCATTIDATQKTTTTARTPTPRPPPPPPPQLPLSRAIIENDANMHINTDAQRMSTSTTLPPITTSAPMEIGDSDW